MELRSWVSGLSRTVVPTAVLAVLLASALAGCGGEEPGSERVAPGVPTQLSSTALPQGFAGAPTWGVHGRLLGVSAGVAVLVEGKQITGRDARTGKQRWSLPVGAPESFGVERQTDVRPVLLDDTVALTWQGRSEANGFPEHVAAAQIVSVRDGHPLGQPAETRQRGDDGGPRFESIGRIGVRAELGGAVTTLFANGTTLTGPRADVVGPDYQPWPEAGPGAFNVRHDRALAPLPGGVRVLDTGSKGVRSQTRCAAGQRGLLVSPNSKWALAGGALIDLNSGEATCVASTGVTGTRWLAVSDEAVLYGRSGNQAFFLRPGGGRPRAQPAGEDGLRVRALFIDSAVAQYGDAVLGLRLVP